MFFIGIFSSIIPYLVIAGVYLLGIGIYSIDNRQNKPTVTESIKSLSSDIKIEIAEEFDLYYFSEYCQDDLSNETPSQPYVFSQSMSEFVLFTDPSPPAGTIPLKYCSRPPPTFFLS